MKVGLTLIAVTLGFLFSMNVTAAPIITPPKIPVIIPPSPTKAPEISAESAAIGIALLSGILLLAGERSRTRRT